MSNLKETLEKLGLIFVILWAVPISVIAPLVDTALRREELDAFLSNPSFSNALYLWGPGIGAGLFFGVIGVLLVAISLLLPRNHNGDHPANAG